MPQFKLLIVRFPFLRTDEPDVTDWLVETVLKAKADPRVAAIRHARIDDTPITMSRNLACKMAQGEKADFLLIVDNDMKPDAYLATNRNRLATDPRAVPFWDAAFDFALRHEGPCVVGAPYGGPPPFENVYVFRWAGPQSDHPDPDLTIDAFTRDEAALRGGFEEVAALPTGLMLVDVRALDRVPPPFFEYEWTDQTASEKATTEDVYFTRNLSLAGVPQYVLWDAWAGHWKRKCVGRPKVLPVETVRERLRDSVKNGYRAAERLIMVGEGTNGHDDRRPETAQRARRDGLPGPVVPGR